MLKDQRKREFKERVLKIWYKINNVPISPKNTILHLFISWMLEFVFATIWIESRCLRIQRWHTYRSLSTSSRNFSRLLGQLLGQLIYLHLKNLIFLHKVCLFDDHFFVLFCQFFNFLLLGFCFDLEVTVLRFKLIYFELKLFALFFTNFILGFGQVK